MNKLNNEQLNRKSDGELVKCLLLQEEILKKVTTCSKKNTPLSDK